MSENTFTQILSEVSTFADSANDLASLQNFIVEIIPQRLTYYNWTGFYMLDPADSETLVLGGFRGADPRYLACSLETRSEIVVPIRANGAVIGEIDIDSHGLAAFSTQDKEFLEKCAAIVGAFMERTQ
jgi:L-methionine (R)-S-oxide reductase